MGSRGATPFGYEFGGGVVEILRDFEGSEVAGDAGYFAEDTLVVGLEGLLNCGGAIFACEVFEWGEAMLSWEKESADVEA